LLPEPNANSSGTLTAASANASLGKSAHSLTSTTLPATASD
jgi:hypothetical protein